MGTRKLVFVLVFVLLVLSVGVIYTYYVRFIGPDQGKELDGIDVSSELSWYTISKLFEGTGKSELAPHGNGNVYSPEVIFDDGIYKMWYAGQGQDGHDRIHYATSADGKNWVKKGMTLDIGIDGDHVNDPSVVKVNGLYYMYYTYEEAVLDSEVHYATSSDGLTWNKKGVVIAQGDRIQQEWDSCFLYAPSVLYENGIFKMWYVGRKDVTPRIADGRGKYDCPIEEGSQQHLGYATSSDGKNWTKRGIVSMKDIGVVDVEFVANKYVLMYEGVGGTSAMVSNDGINWADTGIIFAKGSVLDTFGHVTPNIFIDSNGETSKTYLGFASNESWDGNTVGVIEYTQADLQAFLSSPPGSKTTIQGIVQDENGKNCSGSNCPSDWEIDLDGTKTTSENPYFFTELENGTYTIGVSYSGDFKSYYSICNGCTEHPGSSFVEADSLVIVVDSQSYIDLYWKFLPDTDSGDGDTGEDVVPDIFIHEDNTVICGNIDSNEDGKLTIIDFKAFVGVYAKSCSIAEDNPTSAKDKFTCGSQDANGDGKVSIIDFVSFKKRYGLENCAI